jgi:hypothetical protein
MPDPLYWTSGIEYGIQALGHLKREGWEFTCYLADQGPLLEAVAFAIVEQGLKAQVRFVRDPLDKLPEASAVLLPRVRSGEEAIVQIALQTGKPALCSDPSLRIEHAQFYRFERRNWRHLASILYQL